MLLRTSAFPLAKSLWTVTRSLPTYRLDFRLQRNWDQDGVLAHGQKCIVASPLLVSRHPSSTSGSWPTNAHQIGTILYTSDGGSQRLRQKSISSLRAWFASTIIIIITLSHFFSLAPNGPWNLRLETIHSSLTSWASAYQGLHNLNSPHNPTAMYTNIYDGFKLNAQEINHVIALTDTNVPPQWMVIPQWPRDHH